MIRFKRGAALLEKVVKTFEKAIADIDQALADMEAREYALNVEHEEIELAYETASDKNYSAWQANQAARQRALTVRSNIAKLVGAE